MTGAKGSFTLQVSLVSDATFVVVNIHFAARHVSTLCSFRYNSSSPLPIVTTSWGSCADSFFLRPSFLYVVPYTQEELCVLTCPRCALPYWVERVAEAVVYERSGEGKPTGPSKALYPTGRSCDTCDVQKMTRAILLGLLRVLGLGASGLWSKSWIAMGLVYSRGSAAASDDRVDCSIKRWAGDLPV